MIRKGTLVENDNPATDPASTIDSNPTDGVTIMIDGAVEYSAIPFTTTWAYSATRRMMRYVDRHIVVESPSNLDGYT